MPVNGLRSRARALRTRSIRRRDALVALIGWPALLLHGDPTVFDRWLWVRRRLKPGRVRTLDAGTGNGFLAMYAAGHLGNEVVALSFSTNEQEDARRRAALLGVQGITFRVCDLRELDAYAGELGTFDQVLCLETVEHILDDRKLLQDLASTMRPGARLLLTSPHREHVPLYREVVRPVEDGGHVRWGYSPEEMAAILREAGLEVVDQGQLSGVIAQTVTRLMLRLNDVHPLLGWVVTFPARLLRPLDRAITDVTRYPYLSIAVLAAKPST
jgi:2-polyprenyl-3-methyl-5-hydroxy-6-metoxy-1,4-benzoquinol methylase